MSISINNTLTQKGLEISEWLYEHIIVGIDSFQRARLPLAPLDDTEVLHGSPESDEDKKNIIDSLDRMRMSLESARSETIEYMNQKGLFGNKKPRTSCRPQNTQSAKFKYKKKRPATSEEKLVLEQILRMIRSNDVISEIRNCNQYFDWRCQVFENYCEGFIE